MQPLLGVLPPRPVWHMRSQGGTLPTLGAWRSPQKGSGVPDTPPGEHSRTVQKCCGPGKHKCMCVGDRGQLGTKLGLAERGRETCQAQGRVCEHLNRKDPNEARAVCLPFTYMLYRN